MGTVPNSPSLADRLTYPQLGPVEVEIFRAWLKQYPKQFDNFDFNVRVGAGLDPGPTYDDETRRQNILRTKKRIDAVGYKGGRATIIEVKDRAGTTALGELLTYFTLYGLTPGVPGIPALLLVTNTLQPDMALVFAQYQITVQLVSA